MDEKSVTVCDSPTGIAEKFIDVGKKKCTRSSTQLVLLGILAGMFIAFGAHLETIVLSDMGKFFGIGFSKFIGGSVFSVGLMLVLIAGAELFTGNNLIAVGFLKGEVDLSGLLRNWSIVYVSNFIGSILMVGLIYGSGLWKTGGGAYGAKAVSIALGKVSLTWSEALIRGILCNILVVLAVWMAAGAKDIVSKIFAIYFPIMAFVASGFEHCVANMYMIPIGIVLKTKTIVLNSLGPGASQAVTELTWSNFIIGNLIPVTIGNIIGGAVFISGLYYLIYLKN